MGAHRIDGRLVPLERVLLPAAAGVPDLDGVVVSTCDHAQLLWARKRNVVHAAVVSIDLQRQSGESSAFYCFILPMRASIRREK